MDERIDQPDSEFGFAWVRTDESYYIRNEAGDLMRVSDAAFALLERVAAGEIERDDLDDETAEMIARLEGEYLREGEPVVEVVPPDDIALWPRVLLFAALAAVGLLATVRAWPALHRIGDLLHPLRLALFVILVFASIAVHEYGHYLASRKYVDTSVGIRTVNGIVPAIVTDTTAAWILPKNRRRWVNLAGPFLGLSWLCLLVGTHYFVFPESIVLKLAVINLFFQDLFALNPLIHGDGYFLLADTFGLVDFRERGKAEFRNGELTLASAYVFASYAFGVLLMLAMLRVATSIYGTVGVFYVCVLVAIAMFDVQRAKAVVGKGKALFERPSN